MESSIPLLLSLLYPIFVAGLCTFLLLRGLTHSFLICFIIGAILHALPTAGFAIMQHAPGGFAENMRWMPALSAIGMLGSLVSAAGFVLLAIHLFNTETPHEQPRSA